MATDMVTVGEVIIDPGMVVTTVDSTVLMVVAGVSAGAGADTTTLGAMDMVVITETRITITITEIHIIA